MDDHDQAVSTRNHAPRAALERIPGGARVVEVFINARLFVSDAESGVPVVSLAHEALLAHWPLLQEFVAKHRSLLRSRRRLADLCRRWQEKANFDPKGAERLLLTEGSLAEAQEVVRFNFPDLTAEEREFVELSVRKARRRLRRLRAAAGVFAVLAVIASAAGVLAWRQSQLADQNARKVTRDASQAQFLTAAQWLRQDESDRALAHLARALRLDPGNAAAFDRIYTLLGQRSWALPVRTVANEFGVRHVRLLPDRRRMIVGTALDADSVRGIASLQFWDWTRNRLLSLPKDVDNHSINTLTCSADDATVAAEYEYRATVSQLFFTVPPVDAEPESLTSLERLGSNEMLSLIGLSPDGRQALVEGGWVKPDGIDFRCMLLTAVGAGALDKTPPPDIYLAFGKMPAGYKPKTPDEPAIAFLPEIDPDKLLCVWMGEKRILLLCKDGNLYGYDLAARRVKKVITCNQAKTDPDIVLAAFAERKPLLALLRVDGCLDVFDGKSRVANLEKEEIAKAFPRLDDWLQHRQADPFQHDDNTGEFVLRFLDGDQAIALQDTEPRTGEQVDAHRKRSQYCAVWKLPAKTDDADTDSDKIVSWPEGVLPAGRILVGAKLSGNCVVLYDTSGTERLCEPLRHESEPQCVDVLDDGLFATGTENGFLRVWKRLPSLLHPNPPPDAPDPKGKEEGLTLLAQSADGMQLFGQGSAPNYHAVYQHRGVAVDLASHWNYVYGGNFDATGRRLAICGTDFLNGSTAGAINEGACVCDAATGDALSPLLAHDGCSWVGFDPTGHWVNSAGNGYVQFWDARTFAASGPRLAHTGVNFCAWNPVRPEILVSMAADGGMRVWNTSQQTVLHEIAWPGAIHDYDGTASLEFDSTGERFAVRRDGTVSLWDLETGEPLTDLVPTKSDKLHLSYDEALTCSAARCFSSGTPLPARRHCSPTWRTRSPASA